MSIFTKVAVQKPRFNTFDLSHSRKFSTGAGRLYPCFLMETVPNDKVTIQTSQLIRMAPMIAPVMHEVSAYVHFFFMPNRVAWPGWEKFINGGYEGDDNPVFPFINLQSVNEDQLSNMLGLPLWGFNSGTSTRSVSAVPFFMYQKVWYDFYRDQNLTEEEPLFEYDGGLSDGDNLTSFVKLIAERNRAWQHDYFTSALPWTQRGPEATIPLGTSADIDFKAGILEPSKAYGLSGTTPSDTSSMRIQFGADTSLPWPIVHGDGEIGVAIDNSNQLRVDLSNATAASINDLRRAFKLQEWLELNARAGARYNETIRAHFGIDPGDARLHRPIFLGGSSSPIRISEVLQTSETPEQDTPLANMAGHGVSIGGKNVVNYRCREHGYIMGIMSIMPKSAYQNGIDKHWQKFDKFDYFWRSFANIGEQPIKNSEVYVDNDNELDEDTFGYTPRYAEYKYMNDKVSGPFATSLDFWHIGRKFSTRPTLSKEFVELTSLEVNRIFAVPSLNDEQFYVDMRHVVKAHRPMPYFGTPTL